VNSAAFSPDAARIVTASADHTARVWDVKFATMPLRDLVARSACAACAGAPRSPATKCGLQATPTTRPRSMSAQESNDRVWQVTQDYVAQHLKIYIEYPPRQRRGTLALDQVLAKLQEADAAMN
jgi:hypothetical protein